MNWLQKVLTHKFAPLWLSIAAVYIGASIYFIGYQWSNVEGNLEASVIWATPMIASHAVMHYDRIKNKKNKDGE